MGFSRLTVLVSSILLSGISACKSSSTADPGAAKNASSSAPTEILIGAVLSLSGSEAAFGSSVRNGVELAIREQNQQKGIKGKTIRLVTADDEGKAEKAASQLRQLLAEQPVVAVIGSVASSRSIAMAQVAQEQKIPLIAPSSTHPKVTQMGNYIFRVCFIDPFQGAVMAKFVWENLKAKNVAVLRDLGNEYSVGLAKNFQDRFLKLGGKVLSVQGYRSGDATFQSQLMALKIARPDLVYVPGYFSDVGVILKQSRAMGLDLVFAGGDGWDSEALYSIGDALEGNYFSTHYSAEANDPKLRAFVQSYQAAYQAIPDAQAALGYDAALVLFDALKRSPTLSSQELRAAIAETKDVHGVTGSITLNEERNAVKPAVILKLEGGRARVVATVMP